MATFTNSYIEPGVYVETELRPSAVTGVAGPFIPCLVGTVDTYKKIEISIIRGSGNTDTLVYNNQFLTASLVALDRGINVSYNNLVCYQALDIPQNVQAILQEGGSLDANTTFYYKVTALNNEGQTTGSQQVSATTTTENRSIKITWLPVYGATKYRVYGRNNNAQNMYWEVDGSTFEFVDNGSVNGNVGTVPTISTVLGDYNIIVDTNNRLQVEWLNTPRRPSPNEVYKITLYIEKSETDYAPKLFYNTEIDKMYDLLGPVKWDSANNKPKYELPLMARLAFANGASAIWCVSRRSSDTVETLLNKIQTLRNPIPYTIVFSGGYQDNVNSDLSKADVNSIITHINLMSSITEQKERIAIFGAPLNADNDSNMKDNYIQTIRSLKNRRVVYCYPSNIVVEIEGVSREVNGSYLAAAISGLIDSVGIGDALTGQPVAGISDTKDILLRQVKNEIANYGLLILEDSLRIRHALTTDNSSFLTKELKVTRIVDYVSRIVRDTLTSFVNQPYSGGLVSTVGASVKLLLTQLLNANVIYEYGNINVARNESEPNQLDVSLSIKPTPDTNWIYVKISVQS